MNMRFNSLELKYLLTADISNKDVSTIFVSWAKKGYIQLIYKDGMVSLYKQSEISQIEKQYEIIFFNKLFTKDSIIRLNDLYGALYPDYQKIIYLVKKEVDSLTCNTVHSLLKLISFLLMLTPYYMLMSTITGSVHVVSIFVALFYMLPHSFMAYNVNLILHKTQKLSTLIWSIIMFLFFTVSMVGIASLADVNVLKVLVYILISVVFTILYGFITFRQSTASKYFLMAESVYNRVINKTFSGDDLLTHILVFDLCDLYNNETLINSPDLQLNEDSSIQDLHQLVVALGLHLAPNPLPSGNVSASSQ